MRIAARYIVSGDGPPLESGTVVVDGGQIVGTDADGRGADIDFGDAAILPGLINAHTHLEFSRLPAPLEPRVPFAAWIEAVVAWRRAQGEERASAIEAGLRESAAAGVTTLGEISTADWTQRPNASSAPRVVAFREVLGLSSEEIEERVAVAREFLSPRLEITLSEGAATASGDGALSVIRALSPHAPYSVHPDLYRRLLELAADCGAPVAVHLAETHEELQLLADGSGPLVDLFRHWNLWRDELIPQGTTILDYLRPLASAARGLVVHGNYLGEEEIAFLAIQPHLSVVYCPRTHAGFGHQAHPWRRLRSRGIRVVLGTDSRASNPDLNLWNEVRFLHEESPGLPGADLLRMVTIDAAEALGLPETTGRLTPGRAADLAVFSLKNAGSGDVWQRLLSRGSQVIATMRSGRWIFGMSAT